MYLFQKWLVGYTLCLNWGGVYFEIWKHMSQWITVFQRNIFVGCRKLLTFRGCYTVRWTRAPCPTSSGRFLVNIAASYLPSLNFVRKICYRCMIPPVTWSKAIWASSFLGPSTSLLEHRILHSSQLPTIPSGISFFFSFPKSLKSLTIWLNAITTTNHHMTHLCSWFRIF